MPFMSISTEIHLPTWSQVTLETLQSKEFRIKILTPLATSEPKLKKTLAPNSFPQPSTAVLEEQKISCKKQKSYFANFK